MGETVKATGVVSKSAYAQHRGCSPAYVSKLIKIGKLAAPALMPDGKINVILADQMLGAATETAQPSLPTEGGAGGSNYSTARAGREQAEAELARLKLQEKRGEVLSRSE